MFLLCSCFIQYFANHSGSHLSLQCGVQMQQIKCFVIIHWILFVKNTQSIYLFRILISLLFTIRTESKAAHKINMIKTQVLIKSNQKSINIQIKHAIACLPFEHYSSQGYDKQCRKDGKKHYEKCLNCPGLGNSSHPQYIERGLLYLYNL